MNRNIHRNYRKLNIISANDAGRFNEEIVPVTITVKKQDIIVNTDEHPRPQTSLQNLAKLPSIFKKDGLVTAGSSSVR